MENNQSRLAFVTILLGGVVGFGLADYVLVSFGHPTLGAAVWGLGYVGTILLLWYGWLRPLDFEAA